MTRSRSDQKCVLGTYRVVHDEIITQTQLKIDGQDLGVIKNVYWEQTTAIGVNGEISSLEI